MVVSLSFYITLTKYSFQSFNLVNGVFYLQTFSFVINLAIDEIRAELLAIGIAMLGLLIDFVEDTIVEPDLIQLSRLLKVLLLIKP